MVERFTIGGAVRSEQLALLSAARECVGDMLSDERRVLLAAAFGEEMCRDGVREWSTG